MTLVNAKMDDLDGIVNLYDNIIEHTEKMEKALFECVDCISFYVDDLDEGICFYCDSPVLFIGYDKWHIYNR